jgi:hypothetical protein
MAKSKRKMGSKHAGGNGLTGISGISIMEGDETGNKIWVLAGRNMIGDEYDTYNMGVRGC